ncbi:hypothetical protein ABPG74_013016 [Tetrahymena malaccensis]
MNDKFKSSLAQKQFTQIQNKPQTINLYNSINYLISIKNQKKQQQEEQKKKQTNKKQIQKCTHQKLLQEVVQQKNRSPPIIYSNINQFNKQIKHTYSHYNFIIKPAKINYYVLQKQQPSFNYICI